MNSKRKFIGTIYKNSSGLRMNSHGNYLSATDMTSGKPPINTICSNKTQADQNYPKHSLKMDHQ